MRVYFALGGLAPDWASGNSRVAGSARPNPGEFRKFVKAVGTRYSGSYVAGGGGDAPGPAAAGRSGHAAALAAQAGAAQAGTTLPRVDLWSVWNEPNLGNWLHPQHANGVPFAPHHYRKLVRGAKAGLSASGHGGDTMLIGELVPFGAASNRIRPLEFLREMACVNRRYRPFRGKAARKRGCKNFRALPGSGFAHHPYTFAGGPNLDTGHRDDVTIAYLHRLVKALNRLGRKNRLKQARMKIWVTEFGFQTDPPDSVPDADPEGARLPGARASGSPTATRASRRTPSTCCRRRARTRRASRPGSGSRAARRSRASTRRTGCRSSSAGAARARSRCGAASARPGRGRRVTIQSKRGGKWRRLGRATTGKRGYFRKSFRVSAAGKRKYRFKGARPHQRRARALARFRRMAADPARLAQARLYFVTDAAPASTCCARRSPAAWTSSSCARRTAPTTRSSPRPRPSAPLCAEHGALFVLNDRPDLALAAGADGVHVGQDDEAVASVREQVGDGAPDRALDPLARATRRRTRDGRRLRLRRPRVRDADQARLSGRRARPRPARGRDGRSAVVRDRRDRRDERRARWPRPGAPRVVVVRAIRDAPEPRVAAAGLRAALEEARAGVE